MGNFSAICLSPSLAAWPISRYRQHFRDALIAQLRQTHGVEQLADRRLQFLHRPSKIAAGLLRAPAVVETAHNADRPLERADDLSDGDVARMAGQRVPALGTVLADDKPALGEALQDLCE